MTRQPGELPDRVGRMENGCKYAPVHSERPGVVAALAVPPHQYLGSVDHPFVAVREHGRVVRPAQFAVEDRTE